MFAKLLQKQYESLFPKVIEVLRRLVAVDEVRVLAVVSGFSIACRLCPTDRRKRLTDGDSGRGAGVDATCHNQVPWNEGISECRSENT